MGENLFHIIHKDGAISINLVRAFLWLTLNSICPYRKSRGDLFLRL